MRYFDSGVLLKLYLPEPRAAKADQLFATSKNPPPLTDLHALEMRSALRQKAGRGEIDEDDCSRVLAELENDVGSNVYSAPTINWSDVFAAAEAISVAHGKATLCRSLDTLHVALAITLGATEFCTFDVRQSKMAAAAGLSVIP